MFEQFSTNTSSPTQSNLSSICYWPQKNTNHNHSTDVKIRTVRNRLRSRKKSNLSRTTRAVVGLNNSERRRRGRLQQRRDHPDYLALNQHNHNTQLDKRTSSSSYFGQEKKIITIILVSECI